MTHPGIVAVEGGEERSGNSCFLKWGENGTTPNQKEWGGGRATFQGKKEKGKKDILPRKRRTVQNFGKHVRKSTFVDEEKRDPDWRGKGEDCGNNRENERIRSV